MSHVRISGLTFEFTNVIWNMLAAPYWVSHENIDVEPGCVRLLGSGTDIAVTNCAFLHVHRGVRMVAMGEQDVIDRVVVDDNVFSHDDAGGIDLSDSTTYGKVLPTGRLLGVSVMRNTFDHVGFRPDLFGQGTSLQISYPQTAEVAGNIFDRVAAQGVNVNGAKASGAATDRPFSRILIHHNKAVDTLLNVDDFGGIETWQGGPFYVYDNISGNPGGYRNWDHALTPKDEDRFGHAYYLDGAFKNYYFNNIAWGKSKGPGGKLANTSAFQQIISYQNDFFNNTIYNFVRGSRRQAPQAGRDKFLANIWQSMGLRVFRDADPARTRAAGNEADAGARVSKFAIDTDAYARNVFYDIGETFAVFEPSGRWLDTLQAFRTALERYKPLAASVGVMAKTPPLRDAAAHDFRPSADSAARGLGAKVFVPWGLYETVGEWNFTPIQGDPSRILDEHWCMSPYYTGRDDYYKKPTYPLQAVNVTLKDYASGPLENWTTGALRLNGTRPVRRADQRGHQPQASYRTALHAAGVGDRHRPDRHAAGQALPGAGDAPRRQGRHEALGRPALEQAERRVRRHERLGRRRPGRQGAGAVHLHLHPAGQAGPGQLRPSPSSSRPTASSRTTRGWTPRPSRWATRTARRAGWPWAPSRSTGDHEATGQELSSPQVLKSNFLIEAYFRTEPGQTGGVLMQKMGKAGFALDVNAAGGVTLTAKAAGASAALDSRSKVNDGRWHHVIAEADRKARTFTIYVDGAQDATGQGLGADVSLANDADLYVGGTPHGQDLKGAIDFLRMARGTLADSKTTIDELYAWEFNGPFLYDFTGRKRPADGGCAGAIDEGAE